MIIKNNNGEFNLNSSQYNYLMHTFQFNEIDQDIVNKTNFINSTWEYSKADKIFQGDDKYKDKFR